MIKNNNKRKILLCILVSVLFLNIYPFSGLGFDSDATTIKANWLYVDVGDFVDYSQTSWENNLKVSSGGSDLKSFTNLGMVSANSSEILYKASAVFGYEVSVHSVVGFEDIFPGINREVRETYPFFKITRQSAWLSPITYSVSYFNIEKGDYHEHSYEGHIPITVGLRDTTSMQNNIQLNGQTFAMPEYIVDIMGARVELLRSGEIGEYTDEFEDLSGIENGTVNLQEFSDFAEVDHELVDFLNNRDLGFQKGKISEISESPTIQQKMLDGHQGGHEYPNPSPAKDKTFSFEIYAYIQPEVYEHVQYNEVCYAAINFDDWGWNIGYIEVVKGPVNRALPRRVVAIHTNNYFLHWDLEFEVEFHATVPSTAELTEAVLDDPYLQMGDFIWDTSLTGDYKVDIPLTYPPDIFSEFLGIIILIVVVIAGIYIFMKIGVPLLMFKLGQKSRKS